MMLDHTLANAFWETEATDAHVRCILLSAGVYEHLRTHGDYRPKGPSEGVFWDVPVRVAPAQDDSVVVLRYERAGKLYRKSWKTSK
jgi:hypothetical protein